MLDALGGGHQEDYELERRNQDPCDPDRVSRRGDNAARDAGPFDNGCVLSVVNYNPAIDRRDGEEEDRQPEQHDAPPVPDSPCPEDEDTLCNADACDDRPCNVDVGNVTETV